MFGINFGAHPYHLAAGTLDEKNPFRVKRSWARSRNSSIMSACVPECSSARALLESLAEPVRRALKIETADRSVVVAVTLSLCPETLSGCHSLSYFFDLIY